MLAGLYDPAENGLTIDMWSNSDGIEIKNLLVWVICAPILWQDHGNHRFKRSGELFCSDLV